MRISQYIYNLNIKTNMNGFMDSVEELLKVKHAM